MSLEPHILALFGLAIAIFGLGLVTWGVSALSRNKTGGRAHSLLAPTLAVDALDPDLRILYTRTLVLDAHCGTRGVDPPRCRLLGRELRRVLVAAQAERHAGRPAPDAERLGAILDSALEMFQAETDAATIDARCAAWIDEIEEVRAAHV